MQAFGAREITALSKTSGGAFAAIELARLAEEFRSGKQLRLFRSLRFEFANIICGILGLRRLRSLDFALHLTTDARWRKAIS
jgi:hypothetical protein